jgi:hypothetical protein
MTYSLKPPLSYSTMPKKPVSWPFVGMVAATAACLAGTGLGIMVAIVSPIVFDGRGSVFNPLVWLGFLLSVSFWAICLIAPYLGWVFWSRRDEPRAWACMATPLAWGVLTYAVWQFIPAK